MGKEGVHIKLSGMGDVMGVDGSEWEWLRVVGECWKELWEVGEVDTA